MLKSFRDRFRKSEFIRNVLTLTTGTVLAQLVPLVVSPVLTRLFPESSFGTLAVFVSITGILAILATARYDTAVMLPATREKSISIVFLSLKLSLLFSATVLILSFFFADYTASLLKTPGLSLWLYFAGPAVFFISANSVFMYWFNRTKEYKSIAGNKILRNSANAATSVGAGALSPSTGGLIFGQIAGDGLASLVFAWKFFRKNKNTKGLGSASKIREVAVEYKDFPLFSLPAAFFDTLSSQVPVLLITRWFTDSLTGFYFLAIRILSVPMAFIGASVAQTFYQKFAEIIRSGGDGARRFILRIWLNMFLVAIVPVIIIFFFGPQLFQFVFGQGWEESGRIASILSPYILFAFISSPTSTTYTVLRIQHISIIFGATSLIYRLFSIFAGYYLGDFFIGLKILVVCEIVQIIVYNMIVFRRLK